MESHDFHGPLPGATPAAYRGYELWKGWSKDAFLAPPSSREAACLAGELAGIPLGGRRLFELGFGGGALLARAKRRGAEVYGTEVLAPAIDAARQVYGVDAPLGVKTVVVLRRF